MKLSVLLATTLFSSFCLAQGKTKATAPQLSLREKALAEAKIEGQEQTAASDAQVAGMLTLKDPRPEIITRSWKFFAGISGQAFQASGIAKKEGSGIFDLGKNDQTFMPGFELGVLSPALVTGPLSWKLGLRAKGSFASQSTDVTLDSGYHIDDARLNTMIFSGGPVLAMQWEPIQWLSLTVSPQFGNVNYTQTSTNEFATFSKQAGFYSVGYGLDFALGKSWSVFTEWTQRNLRDTTEIALQKDNFELGTKVTW